MTDLTVTLLQTNIVWQNPEANLSHYAEQIASIGQATDLIVLPEMFTTGFTMDPANNAEAMEGPAMQWMAEQATATGAVVTGSLVIEDEGKYYNRLIWMKPDGTYLMYNKRHLFAMAGEHEHYAAGAERLVVEYKGWRICPLVCYDLRFPVWSRNDGAYDLLIYTANWPEKRAYDWNTLLKARAVENQCYTIGVNRVGEDANGHRYNGDSCVIDPGWRKTLFHVEKKETVHSEVLSAAHLAEVRAKLPFLMDRDGFTVSGL
ncbi:amidohydrolase [Neolewinella aurantiaca]|uniref:Omega-amidase YafV n=1 Tax=Neolewinella aurantiaca TaxID=2602767 RepID=A0A5C7FQL3_9BACT|nr:amidohydrolase [Neolewinella aurantiaca]TXF90115.1 amidohydrolase [Neolewinella aurantiaca]